MSPNLKDYTKNSVLQTKFLICGHRSAGELTCLYEYSDEDNTKYRVKNRTEKWENLLHALKWKV